VYAPPYRPQVKTLTATSNLQQLAEEVVDKCKLIHQSKVGQVHTLLKRLQDRVTRHSSGRDEGASQRRQPAGECRWCRASTSTLCRPCDTPASLDGNQG
jgi:hypothetical protein